MDEEKIDYDMLIRKSLECRLYAEQAETADERSRWIKMADELLARAQDFEEE
jgi:hypothetical protein